MPVEAKLREEVEKRLEEVYNEALGSLESEAAGIEAAVRRELEEIKRMLIEGLKP